MWTIVSPHMTLLWVWIMVCLEGRKTFIVECHKLYSIHNMSALRKQRGP
jgi:hypothetical protein